jgi:hypothetical protein
VLLSSIGALQEFLSLFLFVWFLWNWDFNSGLSACKVGIHKVGTLPLEPIPSVHFALVNLEMGFL